MNLAAIFALLLQSGVCAQTEFNGVDGRTLAIMVCPRTVAPDSTAPTEPAPPPPADAAPEPPSSHT